MFSEKYMLHAIEEAKKAITMNEIPVGAVIVDTFGNIIASTHNLTKSEVCATKHAEMIAIEIASKVIGTTILDTCDIYITLEPCQMCAFALSLCKIRRVYFACYDYNCGALGGKINIFDLNAHYHKYDFFAGFMEDVCSDMLKSFFAKKRA